MGVHNKKLLLVISEKSKGINHNWPSYNVISSRDLLKKPA